MLQLIGAEAFTPDTLPGNIRGISIRLMLAVAGNSDSHIQYYLVHSLPKSGNSVPGFCLQILSKEVVLN